VKCWGTSVKSYDVNMHRQSVREVALLLVALIFTPLSIFFSLSHSLIHFSLWIVLILIFKGDMGKNEKDRRCC